ncbi:T9SS type A sorting domain-containing protein, partial [candidate division KSB1 bacterium]|nr:T9SS type A sorting domain-containing protein [candidate division KSB1 bacterium]
AGNGQVTWRSARHGISLWQTPGGDCSESPGDIRLVGAETVEYAWDVTSIIGRWMAEPDSNFGFLLKEPQASSANGTKVFHSREADTHSLRPRCIIEVADKSVTRIDTDDALPQTFHLSANHPNPFNDATMLHFRLPRCEAVVLQVFNIRGERVQTLVDGRLTAGEHRIRWQPQTLASGVYFFRLERPDEMHTIRGIYLK